MCIKYMCFYNVFVCICVFLFKTSLVICISFIASFTAVTHSLVLHDTVVYIIVVYIIVVYIIVVYIIALETKQA